jgi:hypothetical protein
MISLTCKYSFILKNDGHKLFDSEFVFRYDRLVNQFEAVSYGSPLFAAFILLPLQQQQPVRFRMKLWCEHSNALRILSLNDQQVFFERGGEKQLLKTDIFY